MYVYLFIIYFVFAMAMDYGTMRARRKNVFLMACFVAIAVFAGFRNPDAWADTSVYTYGFEEGPTLEGFSWTQVPIGYSEQGFYLLSVTLKTVWNNTTFYLTFVSAVSFFFLYKFNRKYCAMPFLALGIYLARFMVGRNMMQIRAGMAIPFVLFFGTYYAQKRDLLKFLAAIAVGYCFHHSILVALPLYFINMVRIKRWHIYVGLLLSFFIAGMFSDVIKAVLQSSDYIQDMAYSYVAEDSDKAYEATLANPMIYYQCAILLVFTAFEGRIRRLTPYYDTLRNGYFYSTVLLIVLCQYAILAGRTSTIFATYEMVMVPLFLLAFRRSGLRALILIGMFVCYTALFSYNYKPVTLSTTEFNEAIQNQARR